MAKNILKAHTDNYDKLNHGVGAHAWSSGISASIRLINYHSLNERSHDFTLLMMREIESIKSLRH